MQDTGTVASALARLHTQSGPSATDAHSDEEDGSPSQIGFTTVEPARAESSDRARCAVCVRETETDGRNRARLSQATTEGAVVDIPDQSLGARSTPEEKFLNILEFELANQNTDMDGSDSVSCRSTDGRVEKPDADGCASCGIRREPTNKITQR